MGRPLQILIVEDNPSDAELVLRELRRAGFEPNWRRVDTEAEYCRHLHPGLDVILSDFAMPQFDGLRALDLLGERGLEVPFILVSGTIGEETAVNAMKHGAADYLLKDRLARLGPAVNQALTQSRLRQERRKAMETVRGSEERLRRIFDGIAAFVGLIASDGRVLEVNRAAIETTGQRREEVIGRPFVDEPWWSYSADVRQRVDRALALAAQGQAVVEELRARVEDGRFIVVQMSFNPLRDASGRIDQIVASGVDITERQHAEAKVREQLAELLRWQEVMLDREDRVQALKAEVNALLDREHQPARYRDPLAP